jgi:hypothetical protein
MSRDDRIRREARALWCTRFGADPPEQADGSELLAQIVQNAGVAEYDRWQDRRLRGVARPR